MSKNKYAILDIQNDDDELQFQDFGMDDAQPSGPASPDRPPSEQPATDGSKQFAFWSFSSYQTLFDVDTRQVTDRLAWSMLPKPGVKYLHTYIRPQPDMYGPFWVCVTLIFTAAVAGNVSEYLQTQGQGALQWHYDFHKVTSASALVFSYAWLLPLLLWAVLTHALHRPLRPSLLEAVCCYGYSLTVLVPVCLVWTVPVLWLRWCVGLVGVVLSGTVLASSFYQALTVPRGAVDGSGIDDVEEEELSSANLSNNKKVAFGVVAVVLFCHVAIASLFMLHFFAVPAGSALTPLASPQSLPNIPDLPHPAALTKSTGEVSNKDVALKALEKNLTDEDTTESKQIREAGDEVDAVEQVDASALIKKVDSSDAVKEVDVNEDVGDDLAKSKDASENKTEDGATESG